MMSSVKITIELDDKQEVAREYTHPTGLEVNNNVGIAIAEENSIANIDGTVKQKAEFETGNPPKLLRMPRHMIDVPNNEVFLGFKPHFNVLAGAFPDDADPDEIGRRVSNELRAARAAREAREKALREQERGTCR